MFAIEGKSGVVCADAESLSECGGTIGKIVFASSFLHRLDSMGWLEGADKNCVGRSFFVCYDIKEVMHPIAKINIGNATGSKHDFGPFGSPVVVSMAGFIFSTEIGFCFCDDATCQLSIETGEKGFP